jgi:DNA-binding transcriptional LysR family regulator
MDEIPDIEFRHLRNFAVIADAGTITEAAARLRIAQPSLSQQLKTLEQRVGAKLFDRTPQGMTLTSGGRALLDGVHRATDELRASLALVRDEPLHARIGLCRGVPQAVLARVQDIATARRPLDITFGPADSHRQADLLRSGRIDFGVLRPPIDDTGLITRIVSDEPLGLVLDRRHPLADRPTLTWTELTGLRLLWFSPTRAPGYAAAIIARLHANGWTPSITIDDHATHTLFRHALLTHRDLVALRPRTLVADDTELVWRAIELDAPHEQLALVARADTIWARLLTPDAEDHP